MILDIYQQEYVDHDLVPNEIVVVEANAGCVSYDTEVTIKINDKYKDYVLDLLRVNDVKHTK